MMFEDEVEESVDLLTVLKGSVSGSAAGNWGEAGSIHRGEYGLNP